MMTIATTPRPAAEIGEVVPFPKARHRAYVRERAWRMARCVRSEARERTLIREALEPTARIMRAQGIAEERIAAELVALEQAIRRAYAAMTVPDHGDQYG